jgi:hypothetical protein
MATTDPYQFVNDAANFATAANNSAASARIAAVISQQEANRANGFASNAAISANRASQAAANSLQFSFNSANSATLALTYATQARTANTITLTSVTNVPAGLPGVVQLSSGTGNGFTGSSSLMFTSGNLNIAGNVNSQQANIANIITSNITASNATITFASIANLGVFSNAIINGNLSVVGNIFGTFVGNGASLFGVAPINSPVFTGTPVAPQPSFGAYGSQIATTKFVADSIANFTGVAGNNFSVTGNILSAQNIVAQVGMTATGNITGGNLRTPGVISAAGNITAVGNLSIGGTIQSNGNLTVNGITNTGNINSLPGNLIIGNIFCGNTTAGNIGVSGNLIVGSVVTAPNANLINLSVLSSFRQNQFTKLGNSSGLPGMIVWDTNYIYVCTAANTWKRVALSSF